VLRRKGLRFEDRARLYLEHCGLRLLEQNFYSRFGEIDLIMRDGETVCFIEVKYRNSRNFGGAASAIPRSKQRKIVKTALCYLASRRISANRPLRFDALLIQHNADGQNGIEWIQNAFYAE
jgi:putative endonuclease